MGFRTTACGSLIVLQRTHPQASPALRKQWYAPPLQSGRGDWRSDCSSTGTSSRQLGLVLRAEDGKNQDEYQGVIKDGLLVDLFDPVTAIATIS